MKSNSVLDLALFSVQQIRYLEQYAYNQAIASEDELMSRAGSAAYEFMRSHWPDAGLITVCCGHGNNGGDGFVVAQMAHEAGLRVKVLYLSDLKPKGPALNAYEAAKSAGVVFEAFDSEVSIEADLIVDAVLGIGLQGEVRAEVKVFIDAINIAPSPVLAIDGPSGLLADSGNIAGTAVKADATISFIGRKQGFYTASGPEYCGEIVCNDLGLPLEAYESVDIGVSLLDWTAMSHWLPKRRRDAHKGHHGHVLVIGGDYGMGGAVRMAAEATMRVGAGLVTVATRPEHVPVVSGSRPELMCTQVANAADLQPLLDKATVVVIGPGLGRTDWAKMLMAEVMMSPLPKVLDADALNLLATEPSNRQDWILTPHPGEASRLLSCSCQQVQANRFDAVGRLQAQYGGVAILKGAGTLIKDNHRQLHLCAAGNPGMATGGMGDILSGVIGGLLGQGLSLTQAAELGVYVHAKAADLAAEEGGERGLLATDLLSHLRELVNPDAK